MSDQQQPPACPECGRRLRQGVRVTANARVKVLVCLDPRTGAGCGYETPPLYKRTKSYRDWNYEYLPLTAGQQRETVTSGS